MKSFIEGQKWYVVYLLFAQETKLDKHRMKCESCEVLFEASSALEVYDKAVAWAQDYTAENLFKFVGVEHIHEIGGERPKDGTELGGRFFDDEDVWERKDELIPQKYELQAIVWEQNRDTPIGKLMSDKDKQGIKEIFGDESPETGD